MNSASATVVDRIGRAGDDERRARMRRSPRGDRRRAARRSSRCSRRVGAGQSIRRKRVTVPVRARGNAGVNQAHGRVGDAAIPCSRTWRCDRSSAARCRGARRYWRGRAPPTRSGLLMPSHIAVRPPIEIPATCGARRRGVEHGERVLTEIVDRVVAARRRTTGRGRACRSGSPGIAGERGDLRRPEIARRAERVAEQQRRRVAAPSTW